MAKHTNTQSYPTSGAKVVNKEPIGDRTLQTPKSPGGLDEVHRDDNLGYPAGGYPSKSNYDTHLKY